MPERLSGLLHGFVMVSEGVLPKPLQNLAKAPKIFPAFAKYFPKQTKTPKSKQKPLRLRNLHGGFRSRKCFCFLLLLFVGFERFLLMAEKVLGVLKVL